MGWGSLVGGCMLCSRGRNKILRSHVTVRWTQLKAVHRASRNRREDFGCRYQREVESSGDRDAGYPDVIIAHYM